MIISRRNKLKTFFNIVCAVVVAFMVGYWLYKYEVEDRDITVVDYSTFEEARNVRFPVATICLADPIVEAKLKKFNASISKDSYLKYIKGELFEEHYENIDYRKVTLNLFDYFLSGADSWRNESTFHNSSITFEHKELWSGFALTSTFFKCFLLKDDMDNHRYVKSVMLTYDLQRLFTDFGGNNTSSLQFYFTFHYPGQLFLSKEVKGVNLKPWIGNDGVDNSVLFLLQIQSFEVLKRRHTRNKNCLENTNNYDKTIMEDYLSKIGCRAPYHKEYLSFPLCKTREKIYTNESSELWNVEETESRSAGEKGVFNTETVDVPMACERIAQIRVTHNLINGRKNDSTFSLQLIYPKEVKVITQSKEVDIHTLIGNIGAYLGLFMGKLII